MLPLEDSTTDQETLPMLEVFFEIFVFVTFDVVCLKSVGLRHSYYLFHFLDLNYKGLNLNFFR